MVVVVGRRDPERGRALEVGRVDESDLTLEQILWKNLLWHLHKFVICVPESSSGLMDSAHHYHAVS